MWRRTPSFQASQATGGLDWNAQIQKMDTRQGAGQDNWTERATGRIGDVISIGDYQFESIYPIHNPTLATSAANLAVSQTLRKVDSASDCTAC